MVNNIYNISRFAFLQLVSSQEGKKTGMPDNPTSCFISYLKANFISTEFLQIYTNVGASLP